MHLPWLLPFLTILRLSQEKSPSQLRKPATPERSLEELVHPPEQLGPQRVGRGAKRRLDLVERFQLTEELDVAQPPSARQHSPHAVDLAGERFDPDADGSDAPGPGMIAVVPLEHGRDDAF